MGGKPWSEQEERIFWREIARRAPPCLPVNGKKRRRAADCERSWVPLVERMTKRMEEVAPGKPHREYNYTRLYEHYHHNYVRNRSNNGRVTYSPNARRFVREYQAWVNQMEAAENSSAASNDLDNIVITPQLQAQATHHQQIPQPPPTQAQAQTLAPHFQAQATHQRIPEPQTHLTQAQAQAPLQSMFARGARNSFQGTEDFNRPMHAPTTTQNHGNMGHSSFHTFPHEYPRYNIAQGRGSRSTHGQSFGYSRYNLIGARGPPSTYGQVYGYPRYSLSQAGGSPNAHGQAHAYPVYNTAQATTSLSTFGQAHDYPGYPPAQATSPSIYGQAHDYPGYPPAQAGSPSTHRQADDVHDSNTDNSSEGQLLHGSGTTSRASQASDDVNTAYASGQPFGNGGPAGARQHENNNSPS